MAKKRHHTRRKAATENLPAFDDSKYDNVRYSMTFEYGELALTRASELLAPHARTYLTIGCAVSLVALIILAITQGNDNYPVVIAVSVVAFALLTAVTSYGTLRLNYVRASTLDPDLYDGTLHVVIDDETVHMEDTRGVGGDYALADLKHVNDNSDGILARFGYRTYVYFPRSAMSEGRFRSLRQLLRDEAAKSK